MNRQFYLENAQSICVTLEAVFPRNVVRRKFTCHISLGYLGMEFGSPIKNIIRTAAEAAGFDRVGIAPVASGVDRERFKDWIDAGHAGEMHYLEARDESGELKRADPRASFPWARSVIVCAINYNTAQPYSTEVRDSKRGWISRYAWSRDDYHDAVLRKLREVEAQIRAALPSEHDLQTRCYVDTGPVVERVHARLAGIGWVGKNTCIINQQIGSWLFLGVILTSLDLTPDSPAADRCGSCTRCIDACPTDAIIAPYQLDASRCISYLTIEKRGAIPEELREGIGRHVFGCDICQDVCPWNRRAPATIVEEFHPREGLVNPALEWLALMGQEEFREKFRGSPVRRTKLSGLRRNAVIAIGNSKDASFIPLLQRLVHDDDEVVAESASWSLHRLNGVTE